MPESYHPVRELLETAARLRGKPDFIPILSLGGTASVPQENRSGAATDQQLLRLWLDSKRSKHTQRSYARDITLFNEYLASLPDSPARLDAITVRHIESFVKHSQSRGVPARTLARRLSAIKSLLTFAQQTGYLRFNVGTVVKLPPFPQNLAERILTEDEVHACILAARQGRDRTLIRFIYFTGCRVSEVVNVRWKDLSPRDDRCVVTLFGKGGRTRHVPVPLELIRAVNELRHANMSGFVFETRGGRPLIPKDVWRIVRAAARAAGLRGAPHHLRHSHASHAIRRGAHIQVVQQTLGHTSIRTTGDYLHLERGDSSAMHLDPEAMGSSSLGLDE